ncbi:MAG: cupredoxin domain-containing protein [Pseudomonadota bacterium]
MKDIIAGLVITASSTLPISAEEHHVIIQDTAFLPKTLSVARGDTIVFANAGRSPHTATAVDDSFDTGRIGTGQTVAIAVPAAGSIDFICAYHPSMRGRIETD